MATKSTITTIPDRMDGQPPRLLPNGNLAVFDNTQQVWVDSGVRIVPEDDANAVKYFILTTNSVAPQAPTKQMGWGTIEELNNSLRQAGWDENPVSPTEEKRFCWIAIYGRSNVLDPVASAAKKMSVFKPKYTLNTVALWSNYAPSPVITVEAGKIVITNPDGTKIEQEFATSESTDALLKLIQGLQKQVDKAVYAYQGKGAPIMDGNPTNTWLYDAEGQPITQPNLIADVYGTHVGDTYTDLDTTVSYIFVLRPGASASDPASYQWEAIQNTALTKALADIAKMGREKLTIHTEKPIDGYKKGDIWLKDENTRLWAIRDNTTFEEVDWINPYVSATDFEAFKKEYQKLSQQFDTAKKSIKDLTDAMNGVENGVADAFRDNIITEAERRDLSELSKKLDIEQAQLQSNVNYILDNEFLPADLKSELTTKSNKLLAASTGSINKLQESIATAIADNKITEQEREDYNAKYQVYVADVKSLTDCIDKCRQAIDKKIKDSAIDGVQVGGRNLLTLEHLKRVKLYIGESDDPRYYFQGSWSNMYNKNVLPGGTTNFHFLVTNNEIAFQNGSYYTFSCEYLSDETSSGSYIASIFFYYGDGTKEPIGHILSNPAGGGKKAGKIVGTSNPLRVLKGVGGAYGTSGNALMNIQLEKGNKPTSIQPAPEDFEARVADAKSEADKANALLSDIANDSKLTPAEKREASREWEEIKIEKAKNVGLADKYKASKTAYENAYNALNSYITPLLADTSATSDISKTEFTNKFKAYYEAREALLVEVQSKFDKKTSDGIAEAKAIKMPEIDPVTKNWKLWDDEQKKLVDSGLSSKGDNGNSPYISERTKTWWEYDAENPTAQVEDEKRGYKDTGIKADGVAVRPNLMKESALSASDYQYMTVELPVEKYLGSRVVLVKGKKAGYALLGKYVTTEDNELLLLSLYYKNKSVENTSSKAFCWLYDYTSKLGYAKKTLFPKSTEWTRVSSKEVIPQKGTEVNLLAYHPHNNDGIASDATTIYYAAPKIERILPGEPEIPTAYIPHVDDLKGETGEAGESSLDVDITVRGRFHTSWEQADESGQILDMPRPVRSVVNGVKIGGKDYVQLKARMTYGLKDITAVAMNNGGAFQWLVNGQVVASNTDTLNVGTEYADGVDDNVEFKYDDTNIKNWIQ
ncbi:GA-like domain-containing protein [Bacteroides pyogenes]|uniref:GA-like domain-containing protein n=1 Tax=Bacteroides pyogenes TaxID=310300 RepID=UPI004062AC9F